MFSNLQVGDTGENVIILQEKLKMLGLYNGVISGSYGPATQEGVKVFQRMNNLVETGIVNSSTWEKILSYTENPISPISLYPTLKKGSTGNEVRDLQVKLQALLYYPEAITGNFDLETENAVKRFQINNKLTADGIVGNNTWNKLNSLYGNLNDCAINNESNNNTNDTYVVKSGDTLYGIAKRFNTTVNALKSLNNLSSDILKIGQILKIPSNSSTYSTYIVQKGDTLYAIANRYKTSVAALKSLNNLTSDILSIGQVLKIPTNSNTGSNYLTYEVKKGDTLYNIAKQYNTTVDAIKKLNNLSTNIISIGQILKIPN